MVEERSSSGRHAYLIIAHDKPRQLEILLSLLDDPRNDVYLHLDSRPTLCADGFVARAYFLSKGVP